MVSNSTFYKYGNEVFKITKSNRQGKQLMAEFKDGTRVHFGDPEYKEYPGTKRGNAYCKRSLGIGSKYNLHSIKNANTLSRIVLWKCKGDESMRNYRDVRLRTAKKEEFFDRI